MTLPTTAMAILATALVSFSSFGQMRVMSWNVAKLVGNPVSQLAVIQAAHADNLNGFAIPVDIFLFQEVPNSVQAQLLTIVQTSAPFGSTYQMATFTTSGTEDASAGAQCMIYRTQSISEITAGHADITTGAGRQADRWKLSLDGYDPAVAVMYGYSAHLKASMGSSNENLRLSGAEAIRSNSALLPANTSLFYAGDFNLYSNTEPAFVHFLSAGSNRGVDVYGGGDWGGESFAARHTQSPLLVTGTLVGGGMDDRFDFHLPSPAMMDGEGLSVIPGSTRPFGNDGGHFDSAINTGNNTYYPADLARSNSLADALFDASDHIPLIVDYQLPARMYGAIVGLPAKVIVGATFPFIAEVTNAANAIVSSGADELDFAVSSTGNVSGFGSGSVLATNPAAEIDLTLSAPVAGVAYGTVIFSTNSQMAFPTSALLEVQVPVLRHARPSLSSTVDSLATTINVDVTGTGGSSAQTIVSVPLWNLGWNAGQSASIVQSAVVQGASWPVTAGVGSTITNQSATVRVTIPAGSVGPAGATATLRIIAAEENLAGAVPSTIVVTIHANGGQPVTPDLDGDGIVGGGDLAILLASWGSSQADLDGDGIVGGSDLTLMLAAWGS